MKRRGKSATAQCSVTGYSFLASVTLCTRAVLLVLPEDGLSSSLPTESFLNACVSTDSSVELSRQQLPELHPPAGNQASLHVIRPKSVLSGLLLKVAMFSPKGSVFR